MINVIVYNIFLLHQLQDFIHQSSFNDTFGGLPNILVIADRGPREVPFGLHHLL